jgi:hypothetical protein
MDRNERYNETNTISTAGWSAHNLTFGERKPFTKAADGWSAEELEVAGFSLDIRCVKRPRRYIFMLTLASCKTADR